MSPSKKVARVNSEGDLTSRLISKIIMPRKRASESVQEKVARVNGEGDLTSRLRIVKVLSSVAESAMHSAHKKSASKTMYIAANYETCSQRKSAQK